MSFHKKKIGQSHIMFKMRKGYGKPIFYKIFKYILMIIKKLF